MIHITRLDYITRSGRMLDTKAVDLMHPRSGIDALMYYFAAVWNLGLSAHAAYEYGCYEVLCTYKDYSKQPK